MPVFKINHTFYMVIKPPYILYLYTFYKPYMPYILCTNTLIGFILLKIVFKKSENLVQKFNSTIMGILIVKF